jgi:hypothetical protein
MKSSRARSNVLLAAAAWTLYVWVTRMWNIARDADHSFGFKAVHGVLAVISIAFAVAIGVIGLRMRREAAGRRGDAVESSAPAGPEGEQRDRERAIGR